MHKFWMNLLQRLGLWEPGSIYYIGGSDVLPPPLPPAQEQDYLIRMEAGEQEAKSVLIERNLRLVVYIARRFENTGVNIEDLISRPLEDMVDQQLLREALEKLPEREKKIVVLRFGLAGRREKTQKEVADLMGISQSYISRLEKRIMTRLKREILKQTS